VSASPVRRFGPLELWVGNARHAAAYFEHVLGFTPLGEPVRSATGDRISYRVQQGDATVILTGACTSASPVAEFVRRHGEGVAAVDFVVDDSFARPGHTVAGFADVSHTFLAEDTAPEEPTDRGVGIVGLDHLAVSVEPGSRSSWTRHYEEQLGFVRLGDDEHIDLEGSVFDMTSVHARPGVHASTEDARLVFAEPGHGSRRSQIAQYLADYGGPGVHHIAFATDDILAAAAALRQRGLRTLPIPDEYFVAARDRLGDAAVPWRDLERVGVLVGHDEHGLLFQVFTETIGDRGTIFLELIQRAGAAGFGHDNIRALYSGVVGEARGAGAGSGPQ
jgi:4-hydroxyphenylpyruvate dioxygenase